MFLRPGGDMYFVPFFFPPSKRAMTNAADIRALPFASSLCGACYEVCPVKIDIPKVLLHLRAKAVEAGGKPGERVAMAALAWVFGGRGRFLAASRAGRVLQRPLLRGGLIRRLPPPLSAWTRSRDMRPLARRSFREWWGRRR